MLITNRDELLAALQQGYRVELASNGNLQKTGFVGGALQWFSDLFTPAEAIQTREHHLAVCMARMIVNQGPGNTGPQNITQQPLRPGEPLPEQGAVARKILTRTMVEHALNEGVSDHSPLVHEELIQYLTNEYANLHPGTTPDYQTLETFVKEQTPLWIPESMSSVYAILQNTVERELQDRNVEEQVSVTTFLATKLECSHQTGENLTLSEIKAYTQQELALLRYAPVDLIADITCAYVLPTGDSTEYAIALHHGEDPQSHTPGGKPITPENTCPLPPQAELAYKTMITTMFSQALIEEFPHHPPFLRKELLNHLSSQYIQTHTADTPLYDMIETFIQEQTPLWIPENMASALAVLQNAVESNLPGRSDSEIIGVTEYLAAKFERHYPEGTTPLADIVAFVDNEAIALKSASVDLIADLAFGYELDSEALTENREFFQNDLQRTLENLLIRQNQREFAASGFYEQSALDMGRDFSIINGKRIDKNVAQTSANAMGLYKNLLESEFTEPSMLSVVSIFMSQTVLPSIAGMLSGITGGTTEAPSFRENRVKNPSNLEILPTMTYNVSSNPSPEHEETPMMEVSTTDEEITVKYFFSVLLQKGDFLEGEVFEELLKNNVGTLTTTVVIPKNQFPLAPGTAPIISVPTMEFVKTRTLVEPLPTNR